MSIDISVLIEAYSILKQHIPQKDRQEAADSIMSIMVDLLSDEELGEFGGADAPLGRAYKQYAGDDEEEIDSGYED
jgi:hypothetical protein